jgi:hypothetical protein
MKCSFSEQAINETGTDVKYNALIVCIRNVAHNLSASACSLFCGIILSGITVGCCGHSCFICQHIAMITYSYIGCMGGLSLWLSVLFLHIHPSKCVTVVPTPPGPIAGSTTTPFPASAWTEGVGALCPDPIILRTSAL